MLSALLLKLDLCPVDVQILRASSIRGYRKVIRERYIKLGYRHVETDNRAIWLVAVSSDAS